MLVFLNPGRNAASPKKYQEGGTAKAADLQTVCSVGPPTVSDTSFPTDQFSVGGDYVLFLALSTEIGLTNRKEKPLRSCGLTTASSAFNAPSCLFRDGADVSAAPVSGCSGAVNSSPF